jgi:hypothetical protein
VIALPILIWVIIVGAILCAFVISFWVKRHGESIAPESGWKPTDEVFRDPTSQQKMRVWVDLSGGRHYVPESEDNLN